MATSIEAPERAGLPTGADPSAPDPSAAPRRPGEASDRTLRIAVAAFAVGALLAGSLATGLTAARVRSGTASSGATGGTATPVMDHDHGSAAAAAEPADQPLDPATRAELAAQLVAARTAALQYPTVKDAKAAGMLLAGGLQPGAGAHYQLLDRTGTDVGPDGRVKPELAPSFIYAGVRDDDPVVGVMYISMDAPQPEGFAGPNDHWHRHDNVCFKVTGADIEVPFAPDRDVTKEQCDAVQGEFMAKTVWMVHAWVVPGWESPAGVFSHDNPNVRCRDGSTAVNDRGFCLSD